MIRIEEKAPGMIGTDLDQRGRHPGQQDDPARGDACTRGGEKGGERGCFLRREGEGQREG